MPPFPALRDCYIPDDMYDVKCCVPYCYTKFASTTYDVEILIVLQFYLLHKNAHNLQARTKKMLLRTKTSKIMHLIHFSTVMLQSHYTCQKLMI